MHQNVIKDWLFGIRWSWLSLKAHKVPVQISVKCLVESKPVLKELKCKDSSIFSLLLQSAPASWIESTRCRCLTHRVPSMLYVILRCQITVNYTQPHHWGGAVRLFRRLRFSATLRTSVELMSVWNSSVRHQQRTMMWSGVWGQGASLRHTKTLKDQYTQNLILFFFFYIQTGHTVIPSPDIQELRFNFFFPLLPI